MIFLRTIIPLQLVVLRVIFSENRFPLFGITRQPIAVGGGIAR
jgi:hypothetical protein